MKDAERRTIAFTSRKVAGCGRGARTAGLNRGSSLAEAVSKVNSAASAAASFAPAEPPNGVFDIHYTIDLAVCPTVALQPAALDRIYEVLAGVPDADAAGSADDTRR